MPFSLTDEQRRLREDVRAFTEAEIRPRAIELDRAHAYPADVLAELGDRRLTGLTLPEAYGGRGDGLVELVVVVEELAAGLMSVASSLALHLGVATAIERFGTDAQRERFLPDMASFDRVGALGLTETNAGSDKLAMETTAEPVGGSTADADGDADADADEWVLDGEKAWVTNFPNADEVLTYARTGPDADAPHTVTAFLVPASEFAVEEERETLGAWSAPSPRVSLDGVRVPDDRRVGDVGEALVERGQLDTGVNVPARGVGIARAALDDTVAYTSDRRQYGQRIADFQGLRWQVAEMADRVDAARLLTLRAADRADRGHDATRELAMAKVNATEAAVENASDAIQLHGGTGYTTDHHVERYLRDAKLLTIAGGPNAGHRDTLADAVFERRTGADTQNG